MQHTGGGDEPLGPVDPLLVPRFAGPATYARLPRLDQVDRCDVAIVGVPFDGGVTYRPGARFGPAAIRAGSRLMRGYHPGLEVRAVREPAGGRRRRHRVHAVRHRRGDRRRSRPAPGSCWDRRARLVALGGDHTSRCRCCGRCTPRHGPVALVHFDAHLDTWDTYFGAAVHARHAVPPRARGGPARAGPLCARRDPRPAVLARRTWSTTPGSGSRSSARSTT